MIHEGGDVRVALYECIGEFHRVGGGVAYPFDTGHQVDQVQQVRKIHHCAVVVAATVGIDVLTQQVHFPNPALSEAGDFGDHVVHRSRHLFTPGVGNNTEGAVLAAALHDRYERAGSLYPRLGKPVKFLDFREADIHHHGRSAAAGIHHLGQTVQGLGSKNEIDKGCSSTDLRALLAGDAAAHSDD